MRGLRLCVCVCLDLEDLHGVALERVEGPLEHEGVVALGVDREDPHL